MASEFDEEVELEKLFEVLEHVVEKQTEKNKEKLRKILSKIDAHHKALAEDGEYTEMYVDIEYELAPLLNDAEFRSNEVGENALQDTEIFDLFYEFVAIHNENVEVVLASSPFISEELKWKLAESEFEWEEDGTREALARNQNDPKLLIHLAEVGNVNVRFQVALSRFTPVETLDELALETEQCNFQMEEVLFGELSEYRGFTRWVLTQNGNTSRATLEKIANGNLPPLIGPAQEKVIESAKARLREMV